MFSFKCRITSTVSSNISEILLDLLYFLPTCLPALDTSREGQKGPSTSKYSSMSNVMIMWCNVCANDTLALSHAVSAHLFMLLHLLLLVCKHSRVSFLNKPESNNCLFIHNIYGRLSGNLGETSHNLESSCCSAMLSAGHQNVQKVGMGLHELPDFCIEFLFRCLSHRRGKIFRAVCRPKKSKTCACLAFLFSWSKHQPR